MFRGSLLRHRASGAPGIEIMCKTGQHCHLDIISKMRQAAFICDHNYVLPKLQEIPYNPGFNPHPPKNI